MIKSTHQFLAKRFIALSIILLICFGFSLLADYHWVFDLLTHLTRHFFIGGLLLAFLLLIVKKPAWAMLPLSIALVQLPLLSGYKGAKRLECFNRESDTLKILQFNVSKTHVRQEELSGWLENMANLPDIIILIEVSPDWEQWIDAMQNQAYPYVLAQYEYDNFGLAVLSMLPDTVLQRESIGDTGIDSIALTAGSNKQKISFFLLATHPPPPLSAELSSHRDQQLKALAERIMTSQNAASIIAGDLNVTPWSSRFKKLLAESRLRNAQDGQPYLGTWPAWLPNWLAIPIDHTLVSANIHVVQRKAGPAMGSDHRPVLTELRLCQKARL